jgi:hypothetical protein
MIRDLFEGLSHVLNLILTIVLGIIIGAAIVLVDPDDTVSNGVELVCNSFKGKKKGTKADKARKMGFHLEED